MTKKRLAELGIVLPEPSTPAGNFLPWVFSGDLLLFAGQVPLENGEPRYLGKVGRDISVAEAYQAARLCGINLLGQLSAALQGDWRRVVRVLRLGGYVNAEPDFTDHGKVMNGASDLFFQVFGHTGLGVRTAMGAGSLPRGVAVEVDMIVQVIPRVVGNIQKS